MMMPARIATIRPTMTPMNQGASLHSPPILRVPPIGSHLRMDESQPILATGLHVSPNPRSKFILAQTAELNKAKIGSQANIRTIVFSESELEL